MWVVDIFKSACFVEKKYNFVRFDIGDEFGKNCVGDTDDRRQIGRDVEEGGTKQLEDSSSPACVFCNQIFKIYSQMFLCKRLLIERKLIGMLKKVVLSSWKTVQVRHVYSTIKSLRYTLKSCNYC